MLLTKGDCFRILCYAVRKILEGMPKDWITVVTEAGKQGEKASYTGSVPTVTLSMLLDFLCDYQILLRPKTEKWQFTTIIPVSKHDSTLNCTTAKEARALFICHPENAESILKMSNSAFVLILTRLESPPLWAQNYPDRVLCVKEQEKFSYFSFLLQKHLMEIMAWEHDMDQVVLRTGSLRDLLNIGSSLTNNFLTANDSRFNLIAYSDTIEPPDLVSIHLVKIGCLPEEPIAKWKERALKKEFMREYPTEEIPYVQLHHPIYINRSYFASVVMICCGTEYTKGLEDIFMKVLKRATFLCEALWREDTHTSFPHYFFFTRLVSGEIMSKDYLNAQRTLANIPNPSEFKLIALETRGIEKALKVERIIKDATHINAGNCNCFPYRGNFYVLCYSKPSDARLSHKKTLAELDELICKPHGILCGVSQVFKNLEDLDLAYRQTKIAVKMKDAISRELRIVDEVETKRVFLFEETLLSFLVAQDNCNKRFLEFMFSHTIIQKLYEEDKQNGTDYVTIFWSYLHQERNATLVAQQLHMHRNTVLYHIEKIQKRFDFDLCIRSARERMLVDYKAFFYRIEDDDFRNISSPCHPEAPLSS